VVADMLGYSPGGIRHIALSAEAGLGTCDLQKINVNAVNRPVDDKRLSPPPPLAERFRCRIEAQGACCTCMGNLMFALERLKEKGLLDKSQQFLVGQGAAASSADKGLSIAVGRCAAEKGSTDVLIDKCPPSAGIIFRSTVSALKKHP
jgi:hypothetical protein